MRSAIGDEVMFAVGDVHGQLNLLQNLVERCQAYAAQRGCEKPLYVFLGDYVDRGPKSAGVIAFLRAFSFKYRVIALSGNHDQMMVDAVLGVKDGSNWAINGMAPTARSYGHGHRCVLVRHAYGNGVQSVRYYTLVFWQANLETWKQELRKSSHHLRHRRRSSSCLLQNVIMAEVGRSLKNLLKNKEVLSLASVGILLRHAQPS